MLNSIVEHFGVDQLRQVAVLRLWRQQALQIATQPPIIVVEICSKRAMMSALDPMIHGTCWARHVQG